MREPRDLTKYITKAEAVAFFRRVTEDVEKGPSPLIRVKVVLSFWDPAWKDETKKTTRKRVRP